MRAILTYHSIDATGSPISLTEGAFRCQLEWLAAGGVRVVSLDELLSLTDADDAVALTFDDGFASFASHAAPLLRSRGWPVTLFVVTEHVGRTNAWGGRDHPRIPTAELLDWEAIGRLAAQGVTIGSHTRTHPRLETMPAERLADELGGSADRIERELGLRPRWLAYPYGSTGQRVVELAARDYRGGVTTEYRAVRAGDPPLRLPRLDAYYFRHAGGLTGWNSTSFRRKVWVRRQVRWARAALERMGGGG